MIFSSRDAGDLLCLRLGVRDALLRFHLESARVDVVVAILAVGTQAGGLGLFV